MLIKNIVEVNIEIPRVVKGDFETNEDKWDTSNAKINKNKISFIFRNN